MATDGSDVSVVTSDASEYLTGDTESNGEAGNGYDEDFSAFMLNGHGATVDSQKYGPSSLLVDYLRNEVGTGTKTMCREGGCGACTVTLQLPGETKGKAVASCLFPLYGCFGATVTTVEGVGSAPRQGVTKTCDYHKIQTKLAEGNGVQCGFCSPGMVMSMYSLLKGGEKLSEEQIESSFDGNICRCTGYRPIMAAMKEFASEDKHWELTDIEDLGSLKKRSTWRWHGVSGADGSWYTPTTLQEAADQMKNPHRKSRFVAGNTGQGVYPPLTECNDFVSTTKISQLRDINFAEDVLTVGASVTLTQLIETLGKHSSEPGFSYFTALAEHILLVANTAVRNVATWAGNLMLKHAHHSFVSDLFCLFDAVGASLVVYDCSSGNTVTTDLTGFLALSMELMILVAVKLTNHGSARLHTYKVRDRVQSAHAYVTSAFLLETEDDASRCTVNKARITFGGISAVFSRATATESFLTGKSILDTGTLQGALSVLEGELIRWDEGPLLPTVKYRRDLCLGLLYKTLLSVCGARVSSRLQSGGCRVRRPVLTTGQYEYVSDKSPHVLGAPITKVDALKLAAGEAEFVGDMPVCNLAHAAFVLSSVGNAEIDAIDASEAQLDHGFQRLLTAADIPGRNCFLDYTDVGGSVEEVLCSGRIWYAGQPLAVVVCNSEKSALQAARAVKVSYKNVKAPILSINDAITQNSFFPDPQPVTCGNSQEAMKTAAHIVTGSIETGEQYHFHMETQRALVIPVEGTYEVFSSTQWTSGVQAAVADVLNIPVSRVCMKLRRIGGGFGGKTTRPNMVGAAAAIAAYRSNRPVRLSLSLEDNMKIMGRRQPIRTEYKVGFSSEGKLEAIELTAYQDCGHCHNENGFDVPGPIYPYFVDNAYSCQNWTIIMKNCRTNKPAHCYTRCPATLQGIFYTEMIMERAAHQLNRDGITLRKENFYKDGEITKPVGNVPQPDFFLSPMLDSFMSEIKFAERKAAVTKYNKENQWVKKGISVVPMKYNSSLRSVSYRACVTVNASDGSVTITHGGVDMGQGCNTKVTQLCSETLNVPMDTVNVQPTNSLTSAGSVASGGSTTGITNCYAAHKCCKALLTRIYPDGRSEDSLPWKEAVKKAEKGGKDLTASYMYNVENEEDSGVKDYQTFATVCSEVTIDVLTGEFSIDSIDLYYDIGESMNPKLDFGQVEGAVTMGIGFFCHERIVYDKVTGENLTSGTWDYHPPMAGDIPAHINLKLIGNRPNPLRIVRSKVVGEPPLILTCSVYFALRNAVQAYRNSVGKEDFAHLELPCTVERIQQACGAVSGSFIMD